jgi:serine/threonine protein kinase
LDEWEVMDDGTVVGTVSNHPAIEDGDVIATSPLTDPASAAALAVVTTLSGSKYKLGIPSPSASKEHKRNGANLNGTPISDPVPSRRSTPSIAINPQKALMDVHKRADLQYQMIVQSFMACGLKPAPKQVQEEEQDLMEAQRVAKLMYEKALKEAHRAAVLKYDLTREKVGEYLLSGKPIKSTSGKSQIWTAYRENEDGLPTGDPVIVKVSPILEALEREHENYKKATSGLNTGQFVQLHHFLPRAGESKQLYNQCALVMEKGSRDLKNFLSFQEGMRLQGGALRDAAMAAAKCLQAFHSSNLVWTDLKAENFVVMQDYSNGEKLHVKGIDLESAMPYRDNPVDYSPESCPPEFASAFLQGNGPFFELHFSYDIWSYGIFLYELATGEGAFDGKTPAQVTKSLSEPDHEINVMKVEDPRLRNLIKSCLRKDPQRRPSIHMIMMHSYFLASYNPFSLFD